MGPLRCSFAVQLAFFITLLMQCVSGQSEAVLLVQERGKSAMEIWGQFAQIGGASSVAGSGRLLLRNCTRSTQPIEDTQIQNEEWIGLIYLPTVEETIKEQTSSKPTKCSLLDQVKNAMLLGASALIILAMNPALLKELDVQQLFNQPIIVVQKPAGVTKIHGTVKGKSDVSIKISEGAKQQSHYWSTVRLTLWSTCGRSNGGTYREWEGVVCLGSGHGSTKIFSNLWTTLLSVTGTLYLLIMLHGKWITWGENEHHQDMESCLQRLAKASLSKMPSRKYKRKRHLLSRERESCAICLEEFIPGRMIRVLPCYHQFHCSCVDYWLISKRTCPLCKLNIIDQLTKTSEIDHNG